MNGPPVTIAIVRSHAHRFVTPIGRCIPWASFLGRQSSSKTCSKPSEKPPTDVLQNVNILPNGAMIVNNADLPVIQVSAVVSGFNVTGTVIWLSNLRGTYSEATGKMTAKARFQLHVTSDAPGFNNSNCKVPPVGINMSTDKPGAAAFLNGEGTIVDNTAIVNAVPDSACGSFLFVDYSDEVNSYLNLPSLTSGDNILTLRLRMTPSLPPP